MFLLSSLSFLRFFVLKMSHRARNLHPVATLPGLLNRTSTIQDKTFLELLRYNLNRTPAMSPPSPPPPPPTSYPTQCSSERCGVKNPSHPHPPCVNITELKREMFLSHERQPEVSCFLFFTCLNTHIYIVIWERLVSWNTKCSPWLKNVTC